ncbi:MAG TPA: lipopolysaccharide assembly protein LapA domain-containing protein [Coleofasciculaceae cyanobacterium]
MAKLLIMVIVAFWVSAIALISVQNATPIVLKFLTFQSVQLPMGLVIALSAAIGMVGMAIILPLSRSVIASSEREDFE